MAGAAGGVVTGNMADAVAGSMGAKNAVENNYLTRLVIERVKAGKLSVQDAKKMYQINKENLLSQCEKKGLT